MRTTKRTAEIFYFMDKENVENHKKHDCNESKKITFFLLWYRRKKKIPLTTLN